MNDQDLKKIFLEQKVDIPDEGFSERVIRQLPERKSLLPQVIMITCITVGIILTIALQSIVPVFEQIELLINSISRLQIPSLLSIATYISVLALLGIIGYSVAQADAG